MIHADLKPEFNKIMVLCGYNLYIYIYPYNMIFPIIVIMVWNSSFLACVGCVLLHVDSLGPGSAAVQQEMLTRSE